MKLRYSLIVILVAFTSVNAAFADSNIQQMNYTSTIATSSPVFDPTGNALLALLVTSMTLGFALLFLRSAIRHSNEPDANVEKINHLSDDKINEYLRSDMDSQTKNEFTKILKYGASQLHKHGDVDHVKHGLTNLLKSNDGWYSLANLQFFIWTFVISFSFMFVYTFRLFNGALDMYSAGLPASLLGLMGISAGAAIASRSIGNPTQQVESDQEQKVKEWEQKHKPKWQSMFYGAGQTITLSRLQMFLWTVISVIIYIIIFSSIITNTVAQLDLIQDNTDAEMDNITGEDSDTIKIEKQKKTDEKKVSLIRDLKVPDIDQVMLVLMGISQISYLGVKKAEQQ